MALALGLVSSLPFAGSAFAQTLPQGGTVVGGAGTITQTNPNQLTINQATQNLAINWNSFSVGAADIVRFVQPSSSAVALNRVLNGDPSQIYGQIQANGQIVIMSPNGIVFGPNSRVDVNALVATTANISTADFMAGKLLFDQASGDANARVVNQGVISVAQGGFAVLAAAGVSNEGRILATGGTVVLGGTKTFAIDFHGDGLLKFAATGTVDQKPAGADALVENSGSIEANGGRVLMTARAARSVLDNVINTTGIVVAHSAQLVNGEIVIDGGDAGIVSVKGTLDASGANSGESGGTVKVLGEKVGVMADARIDASGNAGGGTVLVGGNYQGKGPEANAQYLYMDARAVIDASSVSGDGGRVILWSDLATRNAGHINVAGARNGGFVEVSSKGFLDFRGTVDLKGLSGRAGSLLLDPNDITIVVGGDSNITGASPFEATGGGASTLSVATLLAALGTGDVTVSTAAGTGGSGDITVASNIAYTGGTARTLSLLADRDIIVSAGITSSTAALNLILNANAVGSGTGSVVVLPTAAAININTQGGDIVMGGGVGLTAANFAANLATNAAIGGGASSVGIDIRSNGSYGVSIATGGGQFLANGRGAATGSNAHGVIISAPGSGAVSISSGVVKIFGTSTSTSNFNAGTVITGSAGGLVSITNGNADFQISGTGGGGSLSPGLHLAYASLTSNSLGTYQISGTAGSTGNHGISLEGNTTITNNAASSGGVVLLGTGLGSGYDIRSINTTNAINVPTSLFVQINADSLDLDTGFTASVPSGYVTFQPSSANTLFNTTSAPANTSLYITQTLLGNLTGDIRVGAPGIGTVTVDAAYTIPTGRSLQLYANTISLANPITYGATGTGALYLNAASALAVSSSLTAAAGGILEVSLESTAGAIAINSPIRTRGGLLTLISGGGITQSSAINDIGAAAPLVLTLTNGSATNLTDASNNFSNITINSPTGTGSIDLVSASAITLQASTIAGNTTFVTSGFTQSGNLTATGGVGVQIETGAGNIALSGVNSLANNLTLITSGNVSIVGTLTVGSLDMSGVTGNLALGANITTAFGLGLPFYNMGTPNALTLTGNTVLQSGQDFTLPLPTDGAYSLALTTTSGNITFEKSVGATTPLTGLTTTASAGQILVYGGPGFSINTNGAGGQTYTAQATGIASFLDLNSSNNAITFNSTINALGSGYLTATHGSGTLSFNGNIGEALMLGAAFGGGAAPPLIELTTVGAGSVFLPAIVSTVNDITIAGAASRSGNIDFSTGGGSISLANAANSFVSGNVGLVTVGGGNVEILAANPTSFGAISVAGDFEATVSDSITFNAPISVANSASFDVTSTGATAGITFQGSANVTLAGGSSSLISDRGVTINTAITTNGGNLLVLGGGATWMSAPTGTPSFAAIPTGNFVGVAIGAGGNISAGGGHVAIAGEGGNNAAGAQHGVHLTGAAQIATTGAGTVSIYGQGGNSAGVANLGVYLQGGATVETVNNALTMVGTGGGSGASFHNIGISVEGGIVRTTGTGALDATGVGGLIGNGVIVTTTGGAIRTTDGNLSVTGTGTDIRTGIDLINYAGTGVIESVGTGNVTVTGFGGSGAGTGAHGVNIDGTAQINSVSGTLDITGTGGTVATASHGIYFNNGAVIESTSGVTSLTGTATTGASFGIAGAAAGWTIGGASTTGEIHLSADTMSLNPTNATLRTTGLVDIHANTAGTTIGLGSTSTGALQLGDLSFVQAGGVKVSTTGLLEVGGLTMANGVDLTLQGSMIAVTGDVTLGPTGLLGLTAISSGVTQVSTSNITARDLLLRGAGNFTLVRDGAAYNNIAEVAADVSGNITLRASHSSGTVEVQTETDALGAVSGISAANLDWATSSSLVQASAADNLVVTGGVTVTAGSGTVTLANAGNDVDGIVSISAASNVSFRNSGATVLGDIVAGSGSVTVRADTGSLTQNAGTTLAGGAGNFTADAGVINLFNVGNTLTSVAFTASGGGSVDYRSAQGFALGASNVSAGLTVQADTGGITQTGAITTGGKYDLTAVGPISVQGATVGGAFRALSSAGALTQSSGSIAFTGSGATYAAATGGVTLNTTGNTLLTGIISGGVLNLSVTGGTLTQIANIVTSGATTLTLGNTYQMTLTDSSNVFGSTVTLAGQGGALAGAASGALVASNTGFTFNGNPVPITLPSTAPVTGTSGGGTSVSTAISSVAPVEALVSTPAFSAALTQTIAAVLSSAVANLTSAGANGSAATGENAEGGSGTAVVVAVPTGTAPAANNAPAGGGQPGGAASVRTPTVAVSGGGAVSQASDVRVTSGAPIGVSVVFPGLSVNPAPGVTGGGAVIRGPIN